MTCQLFLFAQEQRAYMFSRPSNPGKAHTLLTSRQGRDETTTRHGKLVFTIGIFTDSHWQPVADYNQPLLLLGWWSFGAVGLLGYVGEFGCRVRGRYSVGCVVRDSCGTSHFGAKLLVKGVTDV
jgi:hypothetical protein